MKLSFALLEILIGFLIQGINANLEGIRGVPGVDYPTFFEIPVTSFRCSDQKYTPGFYADPETACQVFHYCYNNRQESYLCPTGTIFNQAILACDYWYSSDCVGAASLYSVNNHYQSRSLSSDFGDEGTSGDFGMDERQTSEPIPSNVQYEALNVLPNENDKNKLNQVLSSLESSLPEKYPKEAEEHSLNRDAKNLNKHNSNTNSGMLRLQNLTQDTDKDSAADSTIEGVDRYDRYPQFVASSGPVSPPLINSSESFYEKLTDLYDTNSRLPEDENYQQYTEQQLRSLIEEIRDYEHQMHSERDKNYMFRKFIPEKNTGDSFSDLNESELESMLMANSRKYEDSKTNGSEDGLNEFVSEGELDYDYSDADEDRLNYLHNLRIHDLRSSYLERKFNEGSNQVELPSDADVSTFKETFEAPNDRGKFSKRLSKAEENKNKISRRDPIYVVSEVGSEAPKLPPMRKRPRVYPFGMHEATYVKNPIEIEANDENITSNGGESENVDQDEISTDSDPEALLSTDAINNMNAVQAETHYSNQDVSSRDEYNEGMDISHGNTYVIAASSADEKLGEFRNQNSYVSGGDKYDLNILRNSEPELSYGAYAHDDFSDLENGEHTGKSNIEHLNLEERLPSAEEYETPLLKIRAEHIPESFQDFSETDREDAEGNLHTDGYSNSLSQLNNPQAMYYIPVYAENDDADSELAYQGKLEKNIVLHSLDAYANVDSYAINEKESDSLDEDAFTDEISDVENEKIPGQNDNELDSNFSTSEQNENYLREVAHQSQNPEVLSQNNFRNNPKNKYMDQEGNIYFIESEMAQDPKMIYAAAPNDAELYLKYMNNSSNTEIVDTSLRSENSVEDAQVYGANILENESDSVLGEAYAKNIMEMRDSDFNDFVNSQEFSEITDAPSNQYNDFDAKSEKAPDFFTDEQNEYTEGSNGDFLKENMEAEKISLLEHYGLRNYPQNTYMDQNGNMFYYVDDEMPQDFENGDAANPNEFELQSEDMNSSNTYAEDSELLENANESGQNSDSSSLEGKADEVLGATYAQNIMKMSDVEFNEYIRSPEFSKVSNIPDTSIKNSGTNFTVGGTLEKISLLEHYGLRNYPQNTYMDQNGNMFYYVDAEMPQDFENGDAAPPNEFELQSEDMNSSNTYAEDSALLENANESGQNSDSSSLEDKADEVLGATYAQNIMQMSDAEFKEYIRSQEFSKVSNIPGTRNKEYDPDRSESVDYYAGISTDLLPGARRNVLENLEASSLRKSMKSQSTEENLSQEHDLVNQNIYKDSEGNMFYYIRTEMPEDSDNFNVMESYRPGSDVSWKVASSDHQTSPFSVPENGLPDTDSEEKYAEHIMKMSDTEFKEYLNSQLYEENDIPNTQYSKNYVNKKPKLVNQAFADFQDNIGERFSPPVDESVKKWPNRFELLDSYRDTSEKTLDQYIDREEDFSDDTLKKRVEVLQEGSSEENGFIKQRNIYADSEGNLFYYDHEMPAGDENPEDNLSTVSNGEFDPDSSSENAPARDESFYSEENDESNPSLGEEYAKTILEMSDADFKDYLNSQGFTQESSNPNTRINRDAIFRQRMEKLQSGNQHSNDARDREKILTSSEEAMDENVQSRSNRYESLDFTYVKSDQEFPFDEQQNGDDSSLNEEALTQDDYRFQNYEELSQKYDFRNNPENIYVDSQGNMFYYVDDTEAFNDSEDFDSEAESNLQSVINSEAIESNLPMENAFTGSKNVSSNYLEDETDPASEEFLQSIMKMSDDDFGAYLSSQEFQHVTDIPVPSNENNMKSAEQISENQWSPVQDGINDFVHSEYDTAKQKRNESHYAQENSKDDSIQELNAFEPGMEPPNDPLSVSTGIATDITNKQISEPLHSETAVESIDVNKEDQDELYGDFSDLFAALAKEPEIKGNEKESLKLKSPIVQDKSDFGTSPEDVKGTGYQSSKSSGREFNEQMPFKPLEQTGSAMGFDTNFIPSNLKTDEQKYFSEFSQSPQGFNSFQFQRDFGAAPYQHTSSSVPVVKNSVPVQPKRTEYKPSQKREPTFGGTLSSMKKSKLQMLGIYANALRQRLF